MSARAWLVTALATLALAAAPGRDAPVADAAERGDVEGVRALVRGGADVNAAQGDGMTALHWAALREDRPLAELLLLAGANPAATTRLGGYTPLHLAGSEGSAELVRALLAAGSDPGTLTATGAGAIHLAAEAGSADAVRALLAAGADANRPDGYSERTPLMFAVARNRIDAARALVEAGADLAATSAVVDYAERANKDRTERQRRTRMIEAAKPAEARAAPAVPAAAPAPRGEAAAARPAAPRPAPQPEPERALSYDQLVGKQGGLTALHFAARDGYLEAARLLLDAGAQIDQPSAGDQSTPLLVAVLNGNFDLAMALLERGADPNLVSEDGAGPLFAAINSEWALRTWYPQPTAHRQQRTSYLALMGALLERGADPNARVKTHIWYTAYNTGRMGVDFSGVTAFWRAAYSLDVAAMRLLVAHGADPHIPSAKPPGEDRGDDDGPADAGPSTDASGLPPVPTGGPSVTPLHAATGVGYGTSRVGQQHRHVPDGWLQAATYLVDELGADVGARDHEGYSALHHAAARGDNAVILFLVERGADPTVVSRRGQTTIDMANGPQQRVQPFPETIALLESLGAKNNHRCISC